MTRRKTNLPTYSQFTILVQYRGPSGKAATKGLDIPFAVGVEEAIPEVLELLPIVLPDMMRRVVRDAEGDAVTLFKAERP